VSNCPVGVLTGAAAAYDDIFRCPTRDLCHVVVVVVLCAGSVDSQLRVRVTDAAVSRDLFPADYDHHDHGGGEASESRPTRWMALESLVDQRASSASDVVRTVYSQKFHGIGFLVVVERRSLAGELFPVQRSSWS